MDFVRDKYVFVFFNITVQNLSLINSKQRELLGRFRGSLRRNVDAAAAHRKVLRTARRPSHLVRLVAADDLPERTRRSFVGL